MIECPVCHVLNKDGSSFCLECGQRFAAAASQASNSNLALLTPPQQNAIPQRPPIGTGPNKLHSPLLGNSGDEDEIFTRPTKNKKESYFPHRHSDLLTNPHPESNSHSSDFKPNKNLRSPLLGGEVQDEFSYEESFVVEEINDPNILRSPLLAAKTKVSQTAPADMAPKPTFVDKVPSKQLNEPIRPAATKQAFSKSTEVDFHKSHKGLSQSLVLTLILLTIGAKFYYLYTLGATALTSFAFLLDQFVQVAVVSALIVILAQTMNKD